MRTQFRLFLASTAIIFTLATGCATTPAYNTLLSDAMTGEVYVELHGTEPYTGGAFARDVLLFGGTDTRSRADIRVSCTDNGELTMSIWARSFFGNQMFAGGNMRMGTMSMETPMGEMKMPSGEFTKEVETPVMIDGNRGAIQWHTGNAFGIDGKLFAVDPEHHIRRIATAQSLKIRVQQNDVSARPRDVDFKKFDGIDQVVATCDSRAGVEGMDAK